MGKVFGILKCKASLQFLLVYAVQLTHAVRLIQKLILLMHAIFHVVLPAFAHSKENRKEHIFFFAN